MEKGWQIVFFNPSISSLSQNGNCISKYRTATSIYSKIPVTITATTPPVTNTVGATS